MNSQFVQWFSSWTIGRDLITPNEFVKFPWPYQWGIHLQFLDSVDIHINRTSGGVIEIQHGLETTTEILAADITREKTQQLAKNKAYKILEA